ncbi:MAG: amino acid adenylation domain-containing protein [Candidatus Aminicenantes bacterium]|nr:amino acid adenylation domain-containing protein [Candidatus Aminicenantes bacterium]NIM84543.1 amino acid adenylation domain-containing protein [Candidatus Aminicenantes bacterium]NIN24071.1 amino acid adenylation domain-containing protein [Candidatus Aminicenantes bacterium]NIN47777.1 amino acid adenylation domain-containing protein [Candidatus Aminicenantes bacterium]NIN90715.1 amino acid adenylation domain-containing protein [Candidatus Aminicenantes bacterium]
MHGNISITYRELNQKSNQLAYLLQERGVLADDIVGIMVERSIEMIIGILGILKAGGAYLPIDLEYPAERIKFIMADSGAKILLTNLSEGHHIHHSSFITHHSGNLAYVIYTSGSTGSPRGVLVEHGGVVNTLYWRTNEYRLGTDDAVLQLFSFSFDGFVTSFFTPILSGSRVVLLAEGQQGDVFRIKDTAIKEKVTHFICVPSLYASLLDLCSSGDLAGIRVVTLAGEPVKPALVKKSKALNPGIEIINEYGATENTVVATICRNVREKPLIPIGKPIANTRIYILSLHGNLNPIGIPGELCIAGPGVARGYLNNPELTAQKFQIHNNRWYYRTNRTYIPSKKIYKTGDLARWLPDGNIEFLGRKDFQVKIRGFRIEPGEIEKQLSEHEAIKEALVIAREYETGEKYLCAYVVMNPHLPHSPNFLKEYLSGKLPDYMIPANIVLLEQIPLNPNGKVDIKALPEPEVTSLKEYIPPRNDTEKELVNIWADVLGIDNQRIGIVDDFFELGGHSLKATLLISRIQKVLKVKVHLEEIFKLPTIKKLSVYIMGLTEEKYVSIYPAEETEYYALSSSQQRIYFSHRMDRKAVLYNMPSAWALEGTVDINRLESTFKKLISRQESLRTSFKVIGVGEEVVQCIHDKVEFEIEYYELATEDTERKEEIIHNSKFIIQNSFIRPFDLSQAPLLRVGLIKLPASYFLLVDMHHIISDGVSVNIFVKEFTLLYEGEELPALRIQYKDYSRWEKKQAANDEQRKKIKKQESYWLDQFKEGIPLLDLRTDYPRPAIQNYEGKVTCFEMTSDETRALKKMALEQGTTLYMVLLAICTIMLSKISGKEVVVTGTAVAGRRHADLEPIIGIFINTLALINYPADDKTFILYLKEVKNRTLEAFDNQDYPFEELVNQVVKNRRVDRHPIFDVMFALQDVVKSELTLEGLTLTPYESDFITSKFDLALVAMEKDRKLRLLFQYCTKLFKEETIKRYARYFNEIATAVTINKHVKLKDINISHRLLSLESKTTFDQFDF